MPNPNHPRKGPAGRKPKPVDYELFKQMFYECVERVLDSPFHRKGRSFASAAKELGIHKSTFAMRFRCAFCNIPMPREWFTNIPESAIKANIDGTAGGGRPKPPDALRFEDLKQELWHPHTDYDYDD